MQTYIMVSSKHHNDGKSDLTGNAGDNGMMDSHQKTPPAAVRPGDFERQPFISLTVGLSGRLVTLCYRWPRLGMIGLALCCRGSDGICVYRTSCWKVHALGQHRHSFSARQLCKELAEYRISSEQGETSSRLVSLGWNEKSLQRLPLIAPRSIGPMLMSHTRNTHGSSHPQTTAQQKRWHS